MDDYCNKCYNNQLFCFQYDAAGVFSNFIRVRITLTLEPGGNAYNGVGTVEGLDPDQNVTFSADLTTHATRINAQ